MSQAIQGKHDWIRDHYEKAILLVALIALLVSSVLLVQRIQVDKGTAAFSLARIGWKGSPVALKDTVPFDAILAEARTAASQEQAENARITVSEVRVSCVKCARPIPYEAIECPFCLAKQPAIVNIDTLDTDDDGLPNKIELAWGLDPQDKYDAAGDLDRDGFTNLEEYKASPRTDPQDANSSPDPIVKLRVVAIRAVPFYLRFVGTSKYTDGSLRYQLNLQSKTRTFFTKLGDVVLGYKVNKHEPKTATAPEILMMVRQSDKRPVRLVKGRAVTEQELAILFVNLIDRTPVRPAQRLNDVFVLRGVEYKVVDIRRESVIIQAVKTGEKVTVPLLSSEERAAATGRPKVAAPKAEPAPAW